MIAEAIRKVVDGRDLARDEMHAVFSQVMDGKASDAQKSALLVALRMKGETAEEITGAAMAMRERVTPLSVTRTNLVDTCGTGGDGRGSFNISTVAAIVTAAAGAAVAKHGNRAVSSACGSADLLAELGVEIDLDAARMSEVLNRTGISFLFAPKLHPAMSAVMGVRRELGLRTIFNLLGPLTNPAMAKRQVIGVYSMRLVEVIANVLVALGAEHALVVHSHDGLDEISISAPTRIAEVLEGRVQVFDFEPERLRPIEEIAGGDVKRNAEIARAVLGGEEGGALEIVALNAGAALYVGGIARTIEDGVEIARDSIRSGNAQRKLEELVTVTKELA
jgi:anthranilate phosphoribosyltransferase